MGTTAVDIDDTLRQARHRAFGWHETLDEMGPGGFDLDMWMVTVADEITVLTELAAAHPSRHAEIERILAQFHKFAGLLRQDIAGQEDGA